MKPVAIVIPWYGKDLKGGAEQLAWQVSTRLAARGHAIEVLTTCCAAFLEDWSTNHYPAGIEEYNNLVVRRFKVDKRDGDLFNKANAHGLSLPLESLKPGINPFTFGTREQFVSENINSIALERYLRRNKKKYQAFIFLPYLYGVILNGLPLVADKALFQPCLHDEVYAYLPEVENCMRMCKRLLYNSLGEERLALNLFGPGIMRKGHVVGVGIENVGLPKDELPDTVFSIPLKQTRYILCLGRRDHTKNTTFLVEAFHKYRQRNPQSDLQLILAGPGDGCFGDENKGVKDLGLVSEKEKEALLAYCIGLFQPSRNESYSRVIMESWFYERPVVAHKKCLATAMAVEASGGGWLAESQEEWIEHFDSFQRYDETYLVEKGRKGRMYASQFANWDSIIERYEKVLQFQENGFGLNGNHTELKTQKVHQLTPGFAFGDAISNQAILCRDFIRQMGYDSTIYTEHIDPSMTHEAKLFKEGKDIESQDGLIYHHSIGAGLTDFVINHNGPKALIYHNVTPPDLVRDEDPVLAGQLEKGLGDLNRLGTCFSVSAGDSQFNSRELADHGFNNPAVLPICVSPEKWNIQAEPNMMARLQDGKDNIIFVGRLVANKCQHDLIEVFKLYLEMYGNARLILVGGFIEEEVYYQKLKQKVAERGLEGDVLFTGKVPDDLLHACYRCSHLFWSMSEHEGFGVPLIEAMWFNIPVFAYKSSAVPETLGEGGILFTEKNDLKLLAVTAHLMIHDEAIKKAVLRGQNRRRNNFLPEAIKPQLEKLIRGMNG